MDRKITILVVDDEPDVVTFLQRALESEGFAVIPAYDGLAALDIADTDKPDLILLDIMMPMMSGYEVCRQLKSNPQTKMIPIICVTSAQSPDTRNKARDAGAQALLLKPFATEELIAQVRRQVGGASSESR
ncbi:MAG: response regulator [Candidatus Hydrogenedentes bacterium]|nr:response regulator [Candidatus Hydrogenedentota bacterium]